MNIASEHKKHFLVKNGFMHLVIKSNEILGFFRDDLVYIHLKNGKNYLFNEPLSKLEKTLDPYTFLRVSRTIIINIDVILGLSQDKKGNYYLVTQSNYNQENKHQISKQKFYEIKRFFEQNHLFNTK